MQRSFPCPEKRKNQSLSQNHYEKNQIEWSILPIIPIRLRIVE